MMYESIQKSTVDRKKGRFILLVQGPLSTLVENSFFILGDRVTDGRISSKEPFTDRAM